MSVTFHNFHEFKRGVLYDLLQDAYSYDERFYPNCHLDWKSCDDFIYDHLPLSNQFGFITVVDERAIGFIVWDPRKLPTSVEIGHNCICTRCKGKMYGKIQLQEAVRRIRQSNPQKIIVTTNEQLLPARHMYESVGFQLVRQRENDSATSCAGDFMEYRYNIRKSK